MSRLAVFGFTLILAAGTLSPEPRQGFFDADLPIGYGYQELRQRLETPRAGGPTLALHLSGGSARAFAHLGVLQRLERQGIFPQVVVTNSMGSILGLLYAAGVPLEVIRDALLAVDYSELFTLKLPTSGGVMDPRGLLAVAQALVGDPDISELPIPIVVVCEDLSSMRRVLLCRGSFLTVLRAAIAMPAALDPVRLEDFLLIDGGITNLVPLEPFVDLTDFAVSATAFYDRDLKPDDPVTVLNMGINIAKSRTAVRDIKRYQPFLIRSDVEQFTYMGYRELPEIMARGYEACDERMPELERQLRAAGFTMPGAQAPELAARREQYALRWKEVKRQLLAGRPLPLPGGFGALQVHPLLLKRHRGTNRLEQANYLAGSYSYEAGLSGFRIGAAGDLQGKWAALLSTHTSLGRRLDLGLDGLMFFTVQGEQILDPYLYGRLSAALPLLAGGQLVTGPFFRGELRLPLPSGEPTVYLSSGLEAHLPGSSLRRRLAGELSWFLQSPAVQGLSGELLARVPVAGPLGLFSRALVRGVFAPESGGITPGFNDFYRGVLPGGENPSYGVFNFELILAPASLTFSVWELFLLSDLELSAFGDLLWKGLGAGAALPPPSVGISLGGEVALIGLLPLRASVAGGFDLAAQRPFLTANLTAPY